MLKIGIVGFGFMGRTHFKCWNSLANARVVAVCDANPNIEQDTKRAVGNIGDTTDAIDFSRFRLYHDLDEMLRCEQPDAVSITLPTYLHADTSIKALNAGVNVLCEKPMALTVKDCDRMIEAAKHTGKILQIGHCVRFWPEYAKAKQIVDSHKYGKVVAATFQRLGAAPTWSKDNWFLDEKRSGGVALDLHIHDTDYVQYLFGLPKAVSSFAATNDKGEILHIVTQYIYDDCKSVTAEGGWAMMPSFGFEMSFNIALEKATIVYDLTRSPALRICPAVGRPSTPETEKADGWFLQIAHFAKAIRGRTVPPITTLQESRDSVRIVMAEKQSAQALRKIAIR